MDIFWLLAENGKTLFVSRVVKSGGLNVNQSDRFLTAKFPCPWHHYSSLLCHLNHSNG